MAVEDTTDVTSDVTDNGTDNELDDVEVDVSDIEETDDDEQEAEEQESEAVDESDDESADDDSADSEEAEATDEPEQTDAEREAQHRREMYEQRQREKDARIARVKEAQAEYVNEAAENSDPLELAVRQIQVDQYNTKVEAVSNKLTNGYERAIAEFPVLQSTDPVVQSEINAAIDAFQAQYVTIDDFGNPVENRGDLYTYLQAKATAIEKLTGIRAQRQVDSKTKEKSKTLAPPRRAPQKPKVDPDLAAFDEEAGL